MVRGILAALRPDPLTVQLQARLAVAGLPWQEVAAYLTGLVATETLDAESLMVTVQALEASGQRSDAQAAADSLPAFEQALAASPAASLRRLALAALRAQATQAAGWTTALRTRLHQYRADPAPLVAAAAQFTFPPPLGEEVLNAP
ncbi:MAG: hypothetical protein EOO59_15075 [Hymenobacter sp.]|nr:MAG: hypothetical protein EOO59_15075 [Hymenobacter sp.]